MDQYVFLLQSDDGKGFFGTITCKNDTVARSVIERMCCFRGSERVRDVRRIDVLPVDCSLFIGEVRIEREPPAADQLEGD